MSPADPDMTQYHFDIFADYHQVYLADCGLHAELTRMEGRDSLVRAEEIAAHVDTMLNPEDRARHLGVARGTLCILTARYAEVPVTVEIRCVPLPLGDFGMWDQVVEASLEVPSGCIAIHGPTDYFPEAPRILRRNLYRDRGRVRWRGSLPRRALAGTGRAAQGPTHTGHGNVVGSVRRAR